MRSRTDWETLEAEQLATYACRAAESRGRRHPESEPAYRSAYQRDRDRIIHCTAFRRLEYKTQVFVNHEGDHYRTRLTHTMEVAQIARTLARALRLNEDLTEAIALVHDLGHGPFGHAGEEELSALMAGGGGFDHNRQGLRVVDVLERRYADFPGLNLTYEVREGFGKNRPAEGAPGIDPAPNVSLEAQLVALADEIAYDNHDVDDGVASGLVDSERLAAEVPLWAEALEAAGAGEGSTPQDPTPQTGVPALRVASGPSTQDSLQLRRRIAIRRLIGRMVTDIIGASEQAIAASGVDSPDEARQCRERLIRPSPAMAARKDSLEKYLNRHLYRHHRVNRVTRKSRRFLRALFEEFVAHPEALLGPEWLALAVEEQRTGGLEREAAWRRVICDYIAGMTDRYALDQYRRLFEPFEKM